MLPLMDSDAHERNNVSTHKFDIKETRFKPKDLAIGFALRLDNKTCSHCITLLRLLFLAIEQGVDRSIQLLTALEEKQLEKEDELNHFCASLLDKITSSSS